ncbi:MAG TPA: NfeD family protein [Candidatus Paceibacterota bacterium]
MLSTQAITFFSLCLGGAGFFIISQLLGGHHDGDLDDVGGHDGGGHDHGHHDGDDHGQNPAVFSLRMIMIFAMGFGGAGTIATYYKSGPIAASAWGCVCGLALATLAWFVFRALIRQQASTTTDLDDLVGETVVVEVAIPNAGLGQIKGENSYNAIVYVTAQSYDDRAIPAGTRVIVTEVLGSTVVVKPVNQVAA